MSDMEGFIIVCVVRKTFVANADNQWVIRWAFSRADQRMLCPNKINSNSCCFCLKNPSFQSAEQPNLNLTDGSVGRVSDSLSQGRVFDLHPWCGVVSLSKTLHPYCLVQVRAIVLVRARKSSQNLMTEKLCIITIIYLRQRKENCYRKDAERCEKSVKRGEKGQKDGEKRQTLCRKGT